MITFVIFGSNGMLGNTIASYFERHPDNMNVVRITRSVFDVLHDSLDKLKTIAHTQKWSIHTYIINAIGVIPQKSSSDLRVYVKVNAIFPHILAQVASEKRSILLHFTTDCIYDGCDGPYPEGFPPTDTNMYGITKACGEPDYAMTIRTSIIGEEQFSKKSLLEWVRGQKGKTVAGFTHHFWNGVTCLQIAKVIEYCINHDINWKGVRHIISPETVSKYQLISIINNVYNLDIIIEPTVTKQIHKGLMPSTQMIIPIPTLEKQIQEQYDFFNTT